MTTAPADGRGPLPPPPSLDVLDDPRRLAAVERLVAQGPVGERLERLTTTAAHILRAPVAHVSLIDRREQLIAAVHGLDLPPERRRLPVEHSLCAYTAAWGRPLVVEDARAHPWVAGLDPVTSGEIGAYLGVALHDSTGQALGSLCVYDSSPRPWSDGDIADLTTLAGSVTAELEQHARAGELGSSSVRLQLAAQAADLAFYEYDLRTGDLVWDDRMLELHGYTRASFDGTIGSYDAVVHPDDLPVVEEAMEHAIAVVGDLIVDYRVVLPGGGHRWIKARGRVLPDMLGQAARILGAAYDSSADRELRDELTRLLETMPAAFVRVDRSWTLTYVNAVAEQLYGRTRHELVGQDLRAAFPEARDTAFQTSYRAAMDTGERAVVEAYFEPLDMHFEVHIWPDEHGLSFFFHDISDRTRAHRELQRASDRLWVLSSAGARLSASLQPRQVLGVLADLVVPELASWLVLAVVDEVAELLGHPAAGGDPTRLHVVRVGHEDPQGAERLAEVVADQELRTTTASGVGAAVRTGQPQALDVVPEEVLLSRARDAEHLAEMRLLNTGPVLSVPLRSPSGALGGFTVGSGQPAALDEVLLVDLAARAGVALDNALTFARQRREATDLQRALLPREAAAVPGVVVATRYKPASAEALAGGDFFKTVRVGERLVMMLGDVMGHGTASAARAGQLHGLVAALALEGHAPGALLERLAGGIDQLMELELATLLVCAYEPATRLLTVASAGHPAPLVGRPGQPAYYLELDPGAPIGVPSTGFAEITCELEEGATALLFSDGLVERRGESITVGLERLRDALDDLRLPPEAVADHVLEACGRSAGGDDDVALLVLTHLPD